MFFWAAYVPSKNSFAPHFLKIDPQFPSLADFMDNSKLRTKVKTEVQTGDYFTDISPFLKNKTNKKML
jgi:hypothetical protein